jgi:hypothetical protein
VLSMTRMVGGTLGVAVIGAMVSAIGRGKLESLLPHATSGQLDRLSDALGTGGGAHAAAVGHAMDVAYVDALGAALVVAASVALLGAVLAWLLVAKKQPADAREPDAVLESSALSPAVEQAEAAEGEPQVARA